MSRKDVHTGSVLPPEGELVYPVYIDIPMMVSFIAALEGGFAFAGERTSGSSQTTDVETGASLRLGSLTSVLQVGLSADTRSRKVGQWAQADRVRWQHTGASLFNLLRSKMQQQSRIHPIDLYTHGARIPDVAWLVECSGLITENPLHSQLLGLQEEAIARTAPGTVPPQLTDVGEAESASERNLSRSMSDVAATRDSLDRLPVKDYQMIGSTNTAVLTVCRDYLTEQGSAYLANGEFTVLGKVTRSLDTYDRYRSISRGEADRIRGILQSRGIPEEREKTSAKRTYIQILPLAIFV